MDGTCSDSCSSLSIDSLEKESFNGCSRLEKNLPAQTDLTECKNVTVPFYKGEVLVQDIKRKSLHNNIKNVNAKNSADEKLNLKDFNSNGNMTIDNFKMGNHCSSRDYLFQDNAQRTNSACVLAGQRISRNIEKCLPNCNLDRTRGRSVSYLEQFKKKIYGINKVGSTTCSMAGSELIDHNSNLSYVGSLITDSSMLSMSEFEFYENLMANPNNNSSPVETPKNGQMLDEPAKPNKSPKQNKRKLIILPKSNLVKIENERIELDKRKALQKREDYAKQVKLRNQFNINLQVEKDRKNKFLRKNVKSHIELVDHYHRPNSKKIIKNHIKTDEFVPFSCCELENSVKNKKTLTRVKKKVAKTSQPDKKSKKRLKAEELPDISLLQQRHEQEKNLVNSMRNLIIKT